MNGVTARGRVNRDASGMREPERQTWQRLRRDERIARQGASMVKLESQQEEEEDRKEMAEEDEKAAVMS